VIKPKLSWLTHPITIIVSMAVGMLIGLSSAKVASALAPYGHIYLSLVKMCVIPILITAIASSFAGILRSPELRRFFKRLGFIFILGMLCTSLLGIAFGTIGGFGNNLTNEEKNIIGQYLTGAEDGVEIELHPIHSVADFFNLMIPSNIFKALHGDNSLAILTFSILLGISLGLVTSRASTMAVKAIEGLYEAFLKLLAGIITLLPLGLICIFADQIAKVGFSLLLALGKLVLVINAGALLLLMTFIGLTSLRTKASFWATANALKRGLIVGFAASSSYAAIPLLVKALTERFGFNAKEVKLSIPIGSSVGQICTPFIYSILIIFMVQLYGLSLDLPTLTIIFFGTILLGIATGGSPFVATLNILAILPTMINLPSVAVVTLFIVIIPFIDPFITAANVSSNCMSVAYAVQSPGKVDEKQTVLQGM
jgi:proton glutamate symport protein